MTPIGNSGRLTLDRGYVYAPYIPLQVTPHFAFDGPELIPNSPLEDLVNGVYEEEIESGELSPRRKKSSPKELSPKTFRPSKALINPSLYSIVNVANLG